MNANDGFLANGRPKVPRLAMTWPVVCNSSSNLVNIRSPREHSVIDSCHHRRPRALLRGVAGDAIPNKRGAQWQLAVYPVERGGDEQVIQRPEGDIQIRVDPEVHHSEADSDGGDRRCRDGEHAHSNEVDMISEFIADVARTSRSPVWSGGKHAYATTGGCASSCGRHSNRGHRPPRLVKF